MSISRSGIPYLTHVWNPVIGCYGPKGTAEHPRRCPHCWAAKVCRRIGAAIDCELCRNFVPHVHPERMHVPGGKPKTIGAGFMTDLFGLPEWLPAREGWDSGFPEHTLQVTGLVSGLRDELLLAIQRRAEHTFVTATKVPSGIPARFNVPENWWLLCTCTTQAEIDERLRQACQKWVPERVVLNLEPLMEQVSLPDWAICHIRHGAAHCCDPGYYPQFAGVIVGGMSGPLAADNPVKPDWVRSIRDECQAAGVPLYYKQESAYNPEDEPKLDGRRHTQLPWKEEGE